MRTSNVIWTDDKDEILKKYWESCTKKQLRDLLQIDLKSIYKRARNLNLPINNKQGIRYTKNTYNKFIKLIEVYKNNRKLIASLEEVNLEFNTFSRLLKLFPQFNEMWEKVKSECADTFICANCNKILHNDNKYKINRNVCKDCKKAYRKTLSGCLSGLSSAAKKRNPNHDINFKYLKEIYEKQNGKCYYTHENMAFTSGHKEKDVSMSIDRLDSSKGYLKDNVVLCQWKINRMKTNIPHNEFIQLCGKIKNIREYESNNIETFTDDGF